MTDYDEIVGRVWPEGASSWEVLGGGITNHNVKVTRPDGVFVLRVGGQNTELLGIDRRTSSRRRAPRRPWASAPRSSTSSSRRAGS